MLTTIVQPPLTRRDGRRMRFRMHPTLTIQNVIGLWWLGAGSARTMLGICDSSIGRKSSGIIDVDKVRSSGLRKHRNRGQR